MKAVIATEGQKQLSFKDIPAGCAFKSAGYVTEPAACYWKVAGNHAIGLKTGILYDYPAFFKEGKYEILPEGAVTITI